MRWLLILIPSIALAGGGECEHPRFLEHGCGYEGQDGKDGVDGQDGVDGMDGRDGIDGKDGEIPTEWINETRNYYENTNKWYRAVRDVAAAQAAMQVHLPQQQKSRLTFSGAYIGNTTGVGVGYAYMMDNERRTALTLSLGHAGDETAVRGSFGFEFGGDRRIVIPKVMPVFVTEPELEERAQVFRAQQSTQDSQLDTVQMAQVNLEDRIEALESKPEPKPVIVQAPQQERFTDEQKAAVYEYLGMEDE